MDQDNFAAMGALRRMALSSMSVAAAVVVAVGADARAAEIGDVMTGSVEVAARQIPLPTGEWTVVGSGTNALVAGNTGAYGTVENVILAGRVDGRIDGLVEINANRLPVAEGWGTAADCNRTNGLATIAFYKTPVDGFCFFVVPTELGAATAQGPRAWDPVRSRLHESGAPTPVWLTAGYRVSDRHDILDVRYHLDPRPLGLGELTVSDWSIESVLANPDRYKAVNQLTAWGSLAAGPVEDGFRGAMTGRAAAASLPNAWEVAVPKDGTTPTADPLGRTSRAARLAALDELVESGAIAPGDHAAYLKAIEDAPPPPTPDDYYRLLGAKVVSFNFFRVSVDYSLAFVVTVNSLISGYITAAIVATHSVAQVFNDMWWDSYILAQASAKSIVVDFVYIGVRREGVS